jgi:hypothetical protein
MFGENSKYEPVSCNFNKTVRLVVFVTEVLEKTGSGILNITFDPLVRMMQT